MCYKMLLNGVIVKQPQPEILAQAQAAAQQAPSALVTLLDKGGRIVYTSPSSETMLGYPPDERVGKKSVDYMMPADVDLATIAFQDALLTGESVDIGITFVTKTGGQLGTRAVLYALRDDDEADEVFILAKMLPVR
jgi:PAS domain S-box-containing protein